LPELLLQALYSAGAGTAFLDTIDALEALNPPERFVDDHLLALQGARVSAEVDVRIGEAVKATDAVAFWRLNSELATARRPFALAMSGAVCLANGPVELCDREEFTTGSYQHQLNTPIRVMESGLRATTASLPQNVGLTPTDVMELVSEQTPRLVELLEAAVATVDSLTPPDEFQADHDRLSSYRRSSIANATAGGAAAEAGDGAAFEAAQSAFGIARCAAFDGLETGEFSPIVSAHLNPGPPCGPPPPR
jgi:hypothetical protein